MHDQPRLGVVQSPRSGEDYPLLGDSSGMNRTILDLMVQYDPTKHVLPLRLVRARNAGGDFAAKPELTVRDATDQVVIATGGAQYLGRHDWGTHYATHRWMQTELQCVLTLGKAQFSQNPALFNGSVFIDPRACVPVLSTVKSIAVYNGNEEAPLVTVGSQNVLALRPGANMRMDVTEPTKGLYDGERKGSGITFNAIPGEGEGLHDNCGNDEPLLRSMNLVQAESGSFLLNGDTCFRIEPVLQFIDGGAVIQHGKLLVADDCKPCCDCTDYLSVYKAMGRLVRSVDSDAQTLEQLRDRYLALLAAAQDQIEDARQPLRASIGRGGNCVVAVTAGYHNLTGSFIDAFTIEARFEQLVTPATQSSPAVWAAITPTVVSPQAALFSQAVDIGNTPLSYIAPNKQRASLGSIASGETKSVAFTIQLNTNSDVRVSVMNANDFAAGTVYRTTSTACSDA